MDHVDVAMEHGVAEDARPLDSSIEGVMSADVYLGIFGFRYGHIPPEHEQSITELEYRAAREAGKECLILLGTEANWPMGRVELAALDRIKALRSELQLEHTASFFDGEGDIEKVVSQVVHKWEKRHVCNADPPADGRPIGRPSSTVISGCA